MKQLETFFFFQSAWNVYVID